MNCPWIFIVATITNQVLWLYISLTIYVQRTNKVPSHCSYKVAISMYDVKWLLTCLRQVLQISQFNASPNEETLTLFIFLDNLTFHHDQWQLTLKRVGVKDIQEFNPTYENQCESNFLLVFSYHPWNINKWGIHERREYSCLNWAWRPSKVQPFKLKYWRFLRKCGCQNIGDIRQSGLQKYWRY